MEPGATYLTLSEVDVASLCQARAADGCLRMLCRAALKAKPVRELYEHDRLLPHADVRALMQSAYAIDWANESHDFAVEWTKHEMKFSVDNATVYEIDADTAPLPPDPMYIILNTALA